MDWRPKTFFWLWKCTVLLLPWQVRWFSAVELAGWPWEQGYFRVYPVWLLLLLTVFLAKPWQGVRRGSFRRYAPILAGCIFFVSASLFASHGNPLAIQAIVFWWIQIFLLGIFVFTLFQKGVLREDLLFWFILAIFPHALLGLAQFADQMVHGSKWFGMAAQDPRQLGVSVVEAGDYRLLRSYGGFPHPNIFAAWLGLGLLSTTALAWRLADKKQTVFFVCSGFLFAAAFATTFSRAAWLACGVACAVACFHGWQKVRRLPQFTCLVLLAMGIGFGTVAISQARFVFSRFSSQGRLEQKSLDERAQGFAQFFSLFLRRPFVGYGPNAELVPSAPLRTVSPLQPVHSFFLLALLDFGLLGFFAIIYLFWHVRGYWRISLPFGAWFVLSGLFDHYLWSFWAGQTLVAFICLFCFLPQKQMPEEG